MPRYRVLFITAAFPGRVDPGRAVFVANLARDLSREMDLTILAPRIHREDPVRERMFGATVHRFPFRSEGKLLKEYRRVPRTVAASYLLSGIRAAMTLARRVRPQVILCHWVLPTGPLGLAARRVARAPLVLNAHGSDLNVYVGRGALFRRIAAETLGAASFTIAASVPIRDRIVGEFGIPGTRVEVIPSGIDPAILRGPTRGRARRWMGIPPDARVLLYVGDLTEAKGIRHLGRVVERIHAEREDVWTCLVGRGPAGSLLDGKERVILSGPVPNEAVPAYLAAADIFVFPSLSEGTPVSLMEAQAAGLPAVASRVGGVPDIVEEGRSGLLVPPGDEDALSEAIGRLLDDDEERSRLSGGARTAGAVHASGDRARRVAEILRNAMRAPSPGHLYDGYWRRTDVDRRDARSRERAMAALRLLGGAGRGVTLLDVGCGRGIVAALLQEQGFRVRAIDVSEEAVKEARRRGVAAEVLDIEKVSIPGSYEAILCLEVLEHLQDPRAALGRIVGALRPGGRILVSLPEAPPLLRHALRDGAGHLHRIDRSGAMGIFRDAGLRLVAEDTLSVAPPRWRLTKILLDRAARRLPRMVGISRIYALERRP